MYEFSLNLTLLHQSTIHFLDDQCLSLRYWSGDLCGGTAVSSDVRVLDRISHHWLTKITLALPAYHGPCGAGSSSLVCLCPLIHSGLDGLYKVQCLCGFISVADTVNVTESGGSLFILVCDTVCMHDLGGKCLCGTGHSENPFDGLWFLCARLFHPTRPFYWWISVHYNSELWLTKLV